MGLPRNVSWAVALSLLWSLPPADLAQSFEGEEVRPQYCQWPPEQEVARWTGYETFVLSYYYEPEPPLAPPALRLPASFAIKSRMGASTDKSIQTAGSLRAAEVGRRGKITHPAYHRPGASSKTHKADTGDRR